MSTRTLFLFLVLVCLGIGAPASAVEAEGSRLVDEGRSVQLQGVSRSGTEYACVQGWGVFDGPVDEAAVDAMLRWGVDTVRLPLNESCWLATAGTPPEFAGSRYREAVAALVDRLLAAGSTVILDLHWSSAGGAAVGQEAMANTAHSVAFWSSVAATFADRDDVLFEVYNEPHTVGWDCWRDGCGEWAGMQELVDAIRQTGAEQPIIVNGLEWGNDLRGWLAHRPDDPLDSIVAGVHVYDFNRCSTVDCWNEEIAPVALEVPVVITEFGGSDCTGAWSESLMDWADRHGVSYLAWAWNVWDCSEGPALISSYDGTPTGYGRAVRDHYRGASEDRFVDDDGLVHEANIERMAALGVTRGCNPPANDRYCPHQELTRGQAAAFFTRVFDLDGEDGAGFTDVADSEFTADIGAVAAAGITRGCNPPHNDRYCPEEPITRAQWASFLARAIGLEGTAAGTRFEDTGAIHAADIERVASAGLTRGCNPPHNDRYCPEETVTRAQAASFFARVLAGRE